jgi:hypothetical protein
MWNYLIIAGVAGLVVFLASVCKAASDADDRMEASDDPTDKVGA